MSIRIDKVYAGSYWSDSGAFMGVLPYAIWGRGVTLDERHRKSLSLNLVLIRTEHRCILVDTGLGNRLKDSQKDIYDPSPFILPVSLSELGIRDTDVTDVIMTHLHFDHAGGIVTGFKDGDRLTFPNADYWIQRKEWEMAKEPDGLNRAAYSFKHQLSLLDAEGKINLLDGDAEICPGVRATFSGGHSVGHQIVEIDSPEGYHIYAGDIIPTMFHTSPSVTSAYDISRADSFKAKQYIYAKLKEKQGFLLLDHDNDRWAIPIGDLRV